MSLLIFWLPIIGGILLGSLAFGAYFNNQHSLAIWSAFAGIVCLLLAFALQLQAGVPKNADSVNDAEVRRLRARVSIDSANITDSTGAESPVITLTAKNFGLTPAHDVVWLTDYLWTEDREPALIPSGTGPKSKNALAAGASMSKKQTFDGWGKRNGDLIASGKATIYVFGEISYTDDWGNPRVTKYRFIHGGIAGVRPGKLTYAPEGNEEK